MKNRLIGFGVALVFLFCTPALADAGIPMIYLGLPFLAVLFIPVCAIEIFVLNLRAKIAVRKLLLPVIAGNAVSTLIGYPLSWFLMLGLEFISTGGQGYGVSTLWAKIVAVTLQSAWLIPYECEVRWMVPIAGMIGLIPAYFLSVWFEGAIARRLSKDSKTFTANNMYLANLASYAFLFLVLLGMLVLRYP